MPNPSPVLVRLLTVFAPAFTAPTFAHALTLIYGTILAPGRRTVTAALRAIGRDDERHFTTSHRVLNRAAWSPLALSRILLSLLVAAFVGADAPLLLVIDDTLERRYGRRVADKARYHDPVRSSSGHVVTTSGVRWLCVCALVRVPWSRRPLGAPFPHRALPHSRRQRAARQAASHRPGAGGAAHPPHPPLATRSAAGAHWRQRLRGRGAGRPPPLGGGALRARPAAADRQARRQTQEGAAPTDARCTARGPGDTMGAARGAMDLLRFSGQVSVRRRLFGGTPPHARAGCDSRGWNGVADGCTTLR